MAIIYGDQDPQNLNDTISGTTSADSIYGLLGDDTLYGSDENDLLDGGEDADVLIGELGDDTYVIDNEYDVVIENAAEGTDTVQSSLSFTLLAENVENLVLTGTDPLGLQDAFGNELNNTITGSVADNTIWGGDGIDQLVGNAGNDTLDGGAGADDLIGGVGDDTYVVDDSSDTVTEAADEGADTVQSSVSYTLTDNVEILLLVGAEIIDGTGNALDNVLIGNGADNTLTGNAGNDILDGGEGVDVLVGGTGDDTYLIDNALDTVTESASEGVDTVQSTFSYTLTDHVENLTLIGSDDIDGTGNALDNILTGNSGTNALTGGLGDDTYVIDGEMDTVVELVDEGLDTIQSGVSYSLVDNVENLTLTGLDEINGSGNALDNYLVGNSAANTLDGGEGIDTLVGGDGNDTYIVDDASDVVTENGGEGTDLVQSSVTFTLAANVDDLSLTGSDLIDGTGNNDNNVLIGNGADNTLTGLAGNDTLNGGEGIDTLVGGAGNDTYIVDSTGDVVTESVGNGTDVVWSTAGAYQLSSNVEDLVLIGNGSINGTGNELANTLTGNSADNTLDGGAGVDTLVGGRGNDTYIVDSTSDVVTETFRKGIDLVLASATYTLSVNVENLTLTGSAANGTGNTGNNVLTGNGGNNTLTGLAGHDTLNGGGGVDTLVGGIGDDIYIVDTTTDTITELASEGRDLVQSSVTYSISALTNVENLTLTGSGAISATGNAGNNVLAGNSNNNTLTGNGGNDTLDGGGGVDTLVGGAGDDVYIVDTTTDTITEAASSGTDTVFSSVTYSIAALANLENVTLSGTGANNATGNAVNNILTGNGSNNTLDGGGGNDTLNGGGGIDILIGGAGDDIYVVDTTTDTITEAAAAGTDTVQSSITYTLAALTNVEKLTLTGASAIDGTGNALNNTLTGNAAANVLNGGGGTDTLVGGGGNDTYVVDTTTDVLTEAAGGGNDTVQSSVTFNISTLTNIENVTLTGSSAISATGNASNNLLIGNSNNNTLTGNGGNDIMDGGGGIDTLVGGAGDDIYIVDTTTDTITEAASSGNDLVRSFALTHTLAVNVENLELWGASASNGTGNTLANMLTGNAAANVLDGGTGIDTLLGGLGDDTYIVDSTTDAIRDDNNGGTDTVKSSVNYVIPTTYQYTVNGTLTYSGSTYIENLILTGSVATTGTGNTLNNVLTGNGINNTLKGLAGNDTLEGAGGIDTLEGGAGDDIFIVDTTTDVITELAGEGTDTVQSSVTFTLASLTNVENLTLTGAGANNATGNASSNVLRGNSAANTLTGGAGNDTYLFGRGGAADTVVDTDSTAGNADLLLLDAGIAYDQLWFKHVGNGLEVSVIGTNDKVTVSNWYSGANNQIEKIQVSDGLYLANAQVEALVQAMAAMTPPPLGQTELTAAEHQQLDSVFATTWQAA